MPKHGSHVRHMKPSRQSKLKDHSKKLEERQHLWNEDRIDELMRENQKIQKF